MKTSLCSSCKAEIRWVTMQDSKKWQPLNVVPTEGGTIVVMGDKARVLKRADRQRYLGAGNRLYVSHFATCKYAKKHRQALEAIWTAV